MTPTPEMWRDPAFQKTVREGIDRAMLHGPIAVMRLYEGDNFVERIAASVASKPSAPAEPAPGNGHHMETLR